MSSELEDSLVELYNSETTGFMPPVDLTERLLYIREKLLAHPQPTETGAHVLIIGLEDDPFWQPVDTAMSIGRSTDCDLPLMRSWVSRQHCQIRFDDPDWIIEDQSSQNGFQVNGVKIPHHCLRNGDIIRIGKISLIFVLVGP